MSITTVIHCCACAVGYRLEQARAIREVLVEKLQSATVAELSAEERAARMDEVMMDEERRQKEMSDDLKRLRNLKFQKAQEHHETNMNERNVDAQIQVSCSAIR